MFIYTIVGIVFGWLFLVMVWTLVRCRWGPSRHNNAVNEYRRRAREDINPAFINHIVTVMRDLEREQNERPPTYNRPEAPAEVVPAYAPAAQREAVPEYTPVPPPPAYVGDGLPVHAAPQPVDETDLPPPAYDAAMHSGNIAESHA